MEALISQIGSTQLQQIKEANAEHRQALLNSYKARYPEASISNHFLFMAGKAERASKICEKCEGYCGKCGGFQPVVIENAGELEIRHIECSKRREYLKQRRIERRFNQAGIPSLYVGKSFSDYEVDESNAAAVGWAKRLSSMYICGGAGCGKTFLASIMAQEFLNSGHSVIFGDVPTLLDQLKGTFDSGADSTLEQLMLTLAEAEVLVLDDLGTETPTQWAVERLYLIVNNRYNSGKTLIVTSNYTPDEVQNRLNRKDSLTGTRIISRIKQICRLAYLGSNDKRIHNRRIKEVH